MDKVLSCRESEEKGDPLRTEWKEFRPRSGPQLLGSLVDRVLAAS